MMAPTFSEKLVKVSVLHLGRVYYFRTADVGPRCIRVAFGMEDQGHRFSALPGRWYSRNI